MDRLAILGCAGTGKSTLAAEVFRRTEIPVVHLDVLFYRGGWAPAPDREGLAGLEAAVRRERWILDGNFLSAGDERFRRAQAVVFLDRSRATCLRRVLRRRLPLRTGRSRAGLPAGCAPALNLALLRWIWSYPRVERPRVLRLLGELSGEVTVHHLRSDRDVNRFLAGL